MKDKQQKNTRNEPLGSDAGYKDCTDFAQDAFLFNPIASATDVTGYVQRVPYSEFEARSYEEMFDTPVSYEKE